MSLKCRQHWHSLALLASAAFATNLEKWLNCNIVGKQEREREKNAYRFDFFYLSVGLFACLFTQRPTWYKEGSYVVHCVVQCWYVTLCDVISILRYHLHETLSLNNVPEFWLWNSYMTGQVQKKKVSNFICSVRFHCNLQHIKAIVGTLKKEHMQDSSLQSVKGQCQCLLLNTFSEKDRVL